MREDWGRVTLERVLWAFRGDNRWPKNRRTLGTKLTHIIYSVRRAPTRTHILEEIQK